MFSYFWWICIIIGLISASIIAMPISLYFHLSNGLAILNGAFWGYLCVAISYLIGSKSKLFKGNINEKIK
jgi:hypothetical protein